MPALVSNNIDIEYELAGPENGEVVLFIMGLAGQLTFWPDQMLETFHKAGYRTLRFDNRDIGKSHKFHNRKAPNVLGHALTRRLGIKGRAPYNLEDMASDTIGLLDGLGIAQAHIVGISMGGMIAQIVTGKYPERALSFTGVMTTTNRSGLPRANREIQRNILMRSSKPVTREAQIERSLQAWALIGTKDSGSTQEELRARIEAGIERSNYLVGPTRQIAAIIETGDLRKWTRAITAPALVIHGAADPLVPIACGQDVANNIAGAHFIDIEGMGHDLPKKHLDTLSHHIINHINQPQSEAVEKAA